MDNHLTKNIKLWKLFYQRDLNEKNFGLPNPEGNLISIDINRNDEIDYKINNILNT